MTLTKAAEATLYHGVTGQAVHHETLPAGTQVRRVEQHETLDGPEWSFQVRGHDGWYNYRSMTRPEVR